MKKPLFVKVSVVVTGLLILLTLIFPLITNVRSYIKANSIPASRTYYANANVRSVTTSTLRLVGACSAQVSYDFASNSQIYEGKDTVSCSERDKLVIGNSLPVYYKPDDPSKNRTSVTHASNSYQVLVNLRPGLLLTVLTISLGWFFLWRKEPLNPQDIV